MKRPFSRIWSQLWSQRVVPLVQRVGARPLWLMSVVLLIITVLVAGGVSAGQDWTAKLLPGGGSTSQSANTLRGANTIHSASASQPTAPTVNDPGASSLSDDLRRASARSGVPVPLLAAMCFFAGGMTMHNGQPSEDNGYGCMHLTQNAKDSSLLQAAQDLGVSTTTLKSDMGANIAGGALLLRGYAARGATPRGLGDWYGAVAAYSRSTRKSAAQAYADALYALLREGFSVRLYDGETYTQQPIAVQPNTATLSAQNISNTLPSGCYNDTKVDYPGAIDCILPTSFDCNNSATGNDCSYNGANRPTDYAINRIVVHDIEGTAQSALSLFQTPSSDASAHYIVDTDGTVYQVVHDKDISYQAGNWWYNEHSIGIEHAGVDASGYSWYNATEYLASAKLVAYLAKKYGIPVDHAHIVSHGTIPSPSLSTSPNHVDPGPYWLWDYYLGVVRAQGLTSPLPTSHPNVVTLHPNSDKQPDGSGGKETSASFSFFNLYTSASTKSSLIPYLGSATDVTNETFNVEPNMSYYYVAKQPDAGGSGDEMYEIWYGVNDQANGYYWADGKLAWLAVPPSAAVESQCATTCVVLKLQGPNGGAANIYGRPSTSSTYIIGAAPSGSVFVSEANVIEDIDTAPPTPTPGNFHSAPPPPSTVPPGPTPTASSTATTGPLQVPTPPVTLGPTPATTASPSPVPLPPTFSPVPRQGPLWYEINFNHRQAWVPASEVVLS